TDDDKCVYVALGVAEVERIDDHADIGRIFARLANVRDLDQLERSLVQPAFECLVSVKITISLLNNDVTLQEQTFEDFLDIEGRELGFVRADCDVFQIKENRHRGFGIRTTHKME